MTPKHYTTPKTVAEQSKAWARAPKHATRATILQAIERTERDLPESAERLQTLRNILHSMRG